MGSLKSVVMMSMLCMIRGLMCRCVVMLVVMLFSYFLEWVMLRLVI